MCSPVYEDDDEHNESHDGGAHPDAHLSLQRECRLGLAVVLHSAQREVQIPQLHLESTITDVLHQKEKTHRDQLSVFELNSQTVSYDRPVLVLQPLKPDFEFQVLCNIDSL